MTIATSASAARNGSGIPATARATSRSNVRCRDGGRWGAVREPRRRFGIATYRRRVPPTPGPEPAPNPPPDPGSLPPGYVVLVPPGDRIHFVDWGESGAPAILLVHGLSGSAAVWAPVARKRRSTRHVLAMDLRGHGLSDAPTEPGSYDLDILCEDVIAVAEGSGALDPA